MQITFTKSDIIAEVKHSLSIIGRHVSDEKGVIYSNVTLDTNEEIILTDFLNTALLNITSSTKDFIKKFDNQDTVTIILNCDGDNNDKLPYLLAYKSFLISKVLSRWLFISWPKISDKYEADAKSYLDCLLGSLYNRMKPDISINPLNKLTVEPTNKPKSL